jgi:hypothetical protein
MSHASDMGAGKGSDKVDPFKHRTYGREAVRVHPAPLQQLRAVHVAPVRVVVPHHVDEARADLRTRHGAIEECTRILQGTTGMQKSPCMHARAQDRAAPGGERARSPQACPPRCATVSTPSSRPRAHSWSWQCPARPASRSPGSLLWMPRPAQAVMSTIMATLRSSLGFQETRGGRRTCSCSLLAFARAWLFNFDRVWASKFKVGFAARRCCASFFGLSIAGSNHYVGSQAVITCRREH